MSSHFLIDLFNDNINGVVATQTLPPVTQSTGNYIISVSDDVAVRDPIDLADLLTKKYLGILANHGLFTQISYDAMLDATNIDFANSQEIFTGEKGCIGLYPKVGAREPTLQTTAYGITWAGPGAGPAQAMVNYEVFTYTDTDPWNGAYQRSYQEESPDLDVSLEVSFDGGLNFISAMDKSLVTIPTPSRGTQVVLKFTRTSSVSANPRIFIGSWAVLY